MRAVSAPFGPLTDEQWDALTRSNVRERPDGRWGLAYSPDGEPMESEENYSGLWTSAWFEHLDGPWWIVQQEWD